MEFVTILRVLSERRLLVMAGALLAIVVGVVLVQSGGGGSRGTAQTRVLLDHRRPIVADLGAIADTVGTQASLLSDVMAGDAQRDALAQRAGIPAAQLGMQRLQFTALYASGQLPERAAQAAKGVARPYVVNVTTRTPLPIITIDVVGPTQRDAVRVATATRQTLEALVASRAPEKYRSLVVKPLGSILSADVPAAQRSPIIGLGAALVFLLFWCSGVVVLHGVLRVWRRATAPAPALDLKV